MRRPAATTDPEGMNLTRHRADAPVVVEGLCRSYDGRRVVSDVSFALRAGEVTCLLGPNGAGKTTVIRMLLGLTTPSAGRCLIAGLPYRSLARPLTAVGSMLDGPGAHPGRTGRAHLAVLADASGLEPHRVDVVLEEMGLAASANRRVRGYSLGMRQRLGLAAALLGLPPVLVVDEPGNGLDPAGHVWLRRLLRAQADGGGTVLVSTHDLPEVSATADRVLVIIGGRLVADTTPVLLSRRGESLEDAYLRLVGDVGGDRSGEDR
jgi:ABC-2 type transport system ATP-binding protein